MVEVEVEVVKRGKVGKGREEEAETWDPAKPLNSAARHGPADTSLELDTTLMPYSVNTFGAEQVDDHSFVLPL